MTSVFLMILIAAAGGSVDQLPVVWPDGSVVVDAAVACEGDCWAAVPGTLPQLVVPGDVGLVLQQQPTAQLLVLDDATGTPLTAGEVRWVDPVVPTDLAVFAWSAEDGRLDLAAPARTEIEISAPGYRPESLVLASGSGRQTVMLTPTCELEVVVEPAVEGTVFLAALGQISPFSPLAEVGASYKLVAGRARLPDLETGRSLFGAVLPEGYAPATIAVEMPLSRRLEVKLEPGLRIAGLVHDTEDTPVPGARVTATGSIRDLDDLRYSQKATTDENGHYVVSGLLAGEIALETCAPKYACERTKVGLSSETVAEPQDCVLKPGFDLVVELVDQDEAPLPGVSVKVLGGIRESDDDGRLGVPGVSAGASLEVSARGGGVLPWQGTIVAVSSPQRLQLKRGASVRWPIITAAHLDGDVSVRWKQSRPEDGQPLSEGSGRWDADTAEAIGDGLPPGVVRLVVDIPGFAGLVSPPVELVLGESVILPAAAPEIGETLAGRVVAATSAQPIAGARVTCENGGPMTFRSPDDGSRARSATTDESGTFFVVGLADVSCRVRAEAPGFAPTIIDGVEPGSDLGDVELGVGLTIEGRVVDGRRSAAVGTRVEAWEPAPYAFASEKNTLTGEGGVFRFEGLPVGEWRLEAEIGGRWARRTVEGGDGDVVEVELRVGGTRLTGTVMVGDRPRGPGTLVLEPPGEPSGPVVLLDRDSARRFFGLSGQVLRTTVEANGGFELASVDPGRWTARFTMAAGDSPATTDLFVPDVESHVCVVRFPAGVLRGVVVDDDDRSVGGARVDFSDSGGDRVTFANPGGSFAFAGVAPGQVTLTASSEDYRVSDPTTVDFPDHGDSEPVILALRSATGGRIEATAHTDLGSLGGAPAILVGPSGGTRFLGPDGRAIWDNVDSGSYRVCVRAYGGPVGCTAPATVDDETVEVALDLGRGGVVSVELPEVTGEHPVPRVMLEDGTDLTGIAFLGNPPPIVEGSLMLGPFAAGTYYVAVTSLESVTSGVVDITDGTTVELSR